MGIQSVRGMPDLLGDELRAWEAVEGPIRECFRAFGYQEIRTPALERKEVFSQTVGEDTDIVQKQMYTIERGDELLVLRPEGTASFIRAVIQHQLHRLPYAQRYYYYLPMYRYERPQKGRLRQFFQFGGELINDASPEADAELIVLLDQIYKTLGLTEYEVRINTLGDTESRDEYRDALRAYLEPRRKELSEESQARLDRSPLRILDSKDERDRAIVREAPRMEKYLSAAARAHHDAVKKRLTEGGVAFIDDPLIVRGLDYYSMTAFEFVSDRLGAQSALGGGGRYDGLAARFGEKPIPAVGFALGMERLMIALEATGKLPRIDAGPAVVFAALGDAAFDRLYPISLDLRRKGVRVEMPYERGKGLKWFLKHADRLGAASTLILGDEEMKSGKAIWRNMKSGEQSELSLASVGEEIVGRTQRGA